MLDIEEAISSPQDHFDTPADLLAEADLTRDQKVRALRNWEHDLRELSVATDENMPGVGHEDLIAGIDAALRELDGDSASAPTRHGG